MEKEPIDTEWVNNMHEDVRNQGGHWLSHQKPSLKLFVPSECYRTSKMNGTMVLNKDRLVTERFSQV
jgi:hypothetical protein